MLYPPPGYIHIFQAFCIVNHHTQQLALNPVDLVFISLTSSIGTSPDISQVKNELNNTRQNLGLYTDG